MKINQLKLVASVVKNNCNITYAARGMNIAQSAISRQIQLLEAELDCKLFVRNGKRLIKPTALCESILNEINNLSRAEANIRNIAINSKKTDKGVLRIGTTHTQARFFLPPIVTEFRAKYPSIELVIEQDTPTKLVTMLVENEVDLAVCTEAVNQASELASMKCYSWTHLLIVRPKHQLARAKEPITLGQLSKIDLVTYSHQFAGGSHVRNTFQAAKLQPHIVLAAADSDVIKTYVRLGLGVGIISAMSYDCVSDNDLVALPLEHLFGKNNTRIAWRSDATLPSFANTCKRIMMQHGVKLENRCTDIPSSKTR